MTNAVKLNIFISTWYKNANQHTFSKVTVIVNDKKFWKLHADEHTKRLQCSSRLFVFHLWLSCDVAKQKSVILPHFVYSETFLIGETVPRAGIRSCRFHCTDVQEHRKQYQGWAMSLLVPYKNNLANVTIPYAKKFALCKTQL